jgi:hypothetical protein
VPFRASTTWRNTAKHFSHTRPHQLSHKTVPLRPSRGTPTTSPTPRQSPQSNESSCGNFRLLERLFPQITPVLKINQLETITEAAASILITGN